MRGRQREILHLYIFISDSGPSALSMILGPSGYRDRLPPIAHRPTEPLAHDELCQLQGRDKVNSQHT